MTYQNASTKKLKFFIISKIFGIQTYDSCKPLSKDYFQKSVFFTGLRKKNERCCDIICAAPIWTRCLDTSMSSALDLDWDHSPQLPCWPKQVDIVERMK